jgi:hypothetical protein
MLRPLPKAVLSNLDWAPRAEIARAVSHIANRFHLDLIRGTDDLDDYEAAALEIDELPFVLLHYQNMPPERTQVFMPLGVGRAAEIAMRFAKFMKALDLPNEAVLWRQDADDPPRVVR